MKNRVIWKMFLLEIVTLGIYRLYWLIKTRGEMIKTNPSIKIKSPWLLLIPILVIIAAFVVMIGSLVVSTRNLANCQTTSSNQTFSSSSGLQNNNVTYSSNVDCPQNASANMAGLFAGLVFPLAMLIAVVVYVIWLWGYCKGIEVVTQEKLSFAISLVILVLIPDGIDILIIQDAFNKVAASSTSPASAPIAPPAQ